MKNKGNRPSSADLRRLAEQRLREQKTEAVRLGTELDTLRLLHELQVHQVELEMQNEELIQARSEIEAGLERYTDLYDFAPVGYFTLGPDGTIGQVNIMGASLLGIDRSQLVRRGLGQFVAPDDSDRWNQYFASVLRSAEKQTCELTFTRADGSTFYARLESIRLDRPAQESPAGGKSPAISVAMSDVSERQQAEKAVRDSERLYRAIGESIDYGVWVCDPSGRNIYASESFLKLVGLTQEQCSKFGWGEVLHPDDAERTISEWKECVRTGGKWDVEHRFRGVDGQWHPILARGVPVQNERGDVICWAGINLDISRMKQAEDALQQATEELDRSNKDLAQFAYVVSHDLQEPLRQVTGFMKLLQDRYKGKLDDRADEYIRHAVDGASRMSNLIMDLLAYSRVHTGGRQPSAIACQVALDRALANLGTALYESNAGVTHDPLPTLVADETQIVQLFQNLIGNALKFRREGVAPKIHVGARQQEGQWLFSVKDNGIGISPDQHDRIFVIFQRLHGHEHYPGTGIGLAICKKIVDRHRGRIWVESKVGEGTTFYFAIKS
ncbi:MAG: ATP-binding protein [Phycisphaerae bacterium]|jgi:PAS domain S-box-containing protein